ncbi:conserved hypothetical protein [Trichinella spiralis]|uniref:hypothetical protein n=1 Tax=Trichinella spiralis TaxID=6334 RepID=UPI0001EFE705|nr:conserved hypothetical protein [Trichinella spiralis]
MGVLPTFKVIRRRNSKCEGWPLVAVCSSMCNFQAVTTAILNECEMAGNQITFYPTHPHHPYICSTAVRCLALQHRNKRRASREVQCIIEFLRHIWKQYCNYNN